MTATTDMSATAHAAGVGGQPGLGALVRMELMKLRYRPMTWVVFGLITTLLSGLMSLGYVITRTMERPPGMSLDEDVKSFLFPGVFQEGFSIIGGVGFILLVVIAAAIIGSEYSWGTIRVLVGSGVPRARLLAAKLVTVLIVTTALTLAGFVAFSVTSLVIAVIGGHPVDTSWLDGGAVIDLVLMVARTIFTLLVPALLAFTVAILSRSLAAGIAVGIGVTIFESIVVSLLNMVGGIGETIADLLLAPNIQAISELNAIGERTWTTDGLPDPWRAAALLTIYMAAMVAACFVIFRRRDIASGG